MKNRFDGGTEMDLNCVNNWCKYKDSFYCMENCGSYVKEGTEFSMLNKDTIRAKNLLVFDFKTTKDVAFGKIEEVFSNSLPFQHRQIKEAHYDASGSSTFIIGIE